MHIIGEVWPNQYTLLDILIHLLRISPHWDAWLLLDNGFWSFPPSRSQPCESPFAPNSEVTTCHTQATRYFSILDVLPHSGFARHCPLLNERWQKLWSQKFQTTTPQFSQLEVHGELHIYIYMTGPPLRVLCCQVACMQLLLLARGHASTLGKSCSLQSLAWDSNSTVSIQWTYDTYGMAKHDCVKALRNHCGQLCPVLAYPLPTGGGACSQQPVPTMPGHQLQFSEAAQSQQIRCCTHEGSWRYKHDWKGFAEHWPKKEGRRPSHSAKGEMLPPRQVFACSLLPALSKGRGKYGRREGGDGGKKDCKEKR